MYPVIFIIIAVMIVIHHIYIHPEYDFPDRAFQISDVSNHETWVVMFLALGVNGLCSQYIM